jgi:hypothetical protein
MDIKTTLLDVADELKNVRATLEGGRPTFVGNLLIELGNAGGFCCNTMKAPSCSAKWWKRTAISDTCNFRGKEVCMKCHIVGTVFLDVRATFHAANKGKETLYRLGSPAY